MSPLNQESAKWAVLLLAFVCWVWLFIKAWKAPKGRRFPHLTKGGK